MSEGTTVPNRPTAENNQQTPNASRKLVDVTGNYDALDKIVRHDACFYETQQTVPRYLNQDILAPYIRFREQFRAKTELEAPPLEKILELYLENHAHEAIPDNYREREIV